MEEAGGTNPFHPFLGLSVMEKRNRYKIGPWVRSSCWKSPMRFDSSLVTAAPQNKSITREHSTSPWDTLSWLYRTWVITQPRFKNPLWKKWGCLNIPVSSPICKLLVPAARLTRMTQVLAALVRSSLNCRNQHSSSYQHAHYELPPPKQASQL